MVGFGCGEEDLGQGKEGVSDNGLLMMDSAGLDKGIWDKSWHLVEIVQSCGDMIPSNDWRSFRGGNFHWLFMITVVSRRHDLWYYV